MARSCEARVGDACFVLAFPQRKETTCATVYGEPFHKELDGETSKRCTDEAMNSNVRVYIYIYYDYD